MDRGPLPGRDVGIELRGGSEPVMRDPTLIFAADELLSFLAQAGQSGAHPMPLPTRGLGQVADRSARWPLQQSEDRGLTEATGWQGHSVRAALTGLDRKSAPLKSSYA